MIIHKVPQKFCDHSYTGCSRNSTTTHTLDVEEILRPFMIIHKVPQKFCDHSYSGFSRNSTTTHTLDVEEILRPFVIIHKVSQKFCNDSYTGCCRNSATTQTLSLAENLRLFIPLADWMSKRFREKILHWQYHTFELVLELLPYKSQNKEKEIELKNVYKAILRAPSVLHWINDKIQEIWNSSLFFTFFKPVSARGFAPFT